MGAEVSESRAMNRTLPIAAALLAASLSLPAAASPATTLDGLPVCDSPENLRAFTTAVMQKDAAAQLDLVYSCFIMAGGETVDVIEELPSDSPVARVVKIRITSRQRGAAEGYTLNIGLRMQP